MSVIRSQGTHNEASPHAYNPSPKVLYVVLVGMFQGGETDSKSI
jgi:hypothetical protein